MENNLGYISCTRKPTKPIDYNDFRDFYRVVHYFNSFLCYMLAAFLGDSVAGFAETCQIVRVSFNERFIGLEIEVSLT